MALNGTYYGDSVNLMVAEGSNAKISYTSPFNTGLIYFFSTTRSIHQMFGKHVTLTESEFMYYVARFGCSYLRPLCKIGIEMISEQTEIYNDP